MNKSFPRKYVGEGIRCPDAITYQLRYYCSFHVPVLNDSIVTFILLKYNIYNFSIILFYLGIKLITQIY